MEIYIGLGDNVLMREMNGSPPSPLWGHIQDPEEEKEDEDDDYDEDDEDRVRGRFLWHILLQHQASPREVSPCRRASELLLRLLLLLLLLLL